MPPLRLPATPAAFSLLLGAALLLISCGDDVGPGGPLIDPGGQQDPDIVAVSVDGGAETVHKEASGAPAITCDPRVDWFLWQVTCYDNYTNGSGPNGYDFFFGILFPFSDPFTVGTYTVQGDGLEVHFNNGTRYLAHPNADSTDGTVVVTRADDRIEGTFTATAIDYETQTTTITLTGHFSVKAGYSMSCP